MFPHQKLDWNLHRLEKRLAEAPEDVPAHLDYATACLSRAWFHEGGEPWFNKALTQARRVLQVDPSNPSALTVAGISLAQLDRLEPAARYLDEACKLDPERAEAHIGLALLHEANGDRREAIRELEAACRMAPESWEPHFLLGQMLARHAEKIGSPQRLLERSQFHIVKALALDPAPAVLPSLLHDLGVRCLRGGRRNDAHKIFKRLLEHDKYKAKARYYLGLVLYHMGKYKNAITFLRQHLEDQPDNAQVWTRIGMAFLQLSEVEKAREACNRALAVEPGDLQARWTLGCALLEEGQPDEAIRMFRDILQDAPDHTPAFTELVNLRTQSRDVRWLRQALRAEVSIHDRLPIADEREATGPTPLSSPTPLRDRRRTPMIRIAPRSTTRERIRVVLESMGRMDSDEVPTILEAMDLTTDEGLRFQLWESALDMLATRKAEDASERLKLPGAGYGAGAGREILVLAPFIPEPLLTRGLQVGEEDLKRAAVDRHGPARDVQLHRDNVDRERQEARAWQALLLLAIAAKQTRTGRNLLVRWASDADPELADAARAALAMYGDTQAADRLRERARARGAESLVDTLVREVSSPPTRSHPRPVSEDEDLCCSTCGRRSSEVDHMLAGGEAAVCDKCMMGIARDRRELETDDASISCGLCGNTSIESRGVYVYRGTPVCADCVDQSLGLLEREEVERYLAAW